MWDNKGKESEYAFPKKHLDQFQRYIRESVKRVNVFLVVVPEASPAARLQAIKLKHESGKDTDVTIITAADLKFVAEKWRKYSKDGVFSLDIFNSTGILTRPDLEARMGIFLK